MKPFNIFTAFTFCLFALCSIAQAQTPLTVQFINGASNTMRLAVLDDGLHTVFVPTAQRDSFFVPPVWLAGDHDARDSVLFFFTTDSLVGAYSLTGQRYGRQQAEGYVVQKEAFACAGATVYRITASPFVLVYFEFDDHTARALRVLRQDNEGEQVAMYYSNATRTAQPKPAAQLYIGGKPFTE